MNKFINDWKIIVALSLTLGLAPFVPEPHLFGKVRWIMGGAKGMQLIDWWDLIMHGAPVILLIRLIIIALKKQILSNKN